MQILSLKRSRTFHGHDGKYLQQMVLHHILHRAAGIIITGPVFHAHILHGGNLDAADRVPVPVVCKNRVGEADNLHVADHFFSQIMVDTVNPIRRKNLLQPPAQLLCRLKIFPERFFQNHLALSGLMDPIQPFRNRTEKPRRHRKVKNMLTQPPFLIIILQTLIGCRI